MTDTQSGLPEDGFRDLHTPGTAPRAYVQWKGTDVCCDITCECGYGFHFDGYFMYAIRCPGCKRVLEAPSHIPMRVMPEGEHHDCVQEPEPHGSDFGYA